MGGLITIGEAISSLYLLFEEMAGRQPCFPAGGVDLRARSGWHLLMGNRYAWIMIFDSETGKVVEI